MSDKESERFGQWGNSDDPTLLSNEQPGEIIGQWGSSTDGEVVIRSDSDASTSEGNYPAPIRPPRRAVIARRSGGTAHPEPRGNRRMPALLATLICVILLLVLVLVILVRRSPRVVVTAPSPTSPAAALASAAPSPSPTPTPSISSGGQRTQAPPSATPVNATPTPNVPMAHVAVMVPITNQPGWTLTWHGPLSIGPQGRMLTNVDPNVGPQMGDGSNFDIQYVPGSGTGTGWAPSNALSYWAKPYRPGPATINGIWQNSISDATGAQANDGDLIYEVINTSGNGVDVIAYMQVVAVHVGSVTVDMWIWNRD